ncbi:unnamed protein product [Cylindrotheca closterium]|uniref:Uncharacterized protein n=1 Tax=Cylindrotheca closterium TaxID=2856 RepID=A0AAD2G513_9STRA|nr:unnamed protein product [Cylindrotheca closterium]
MNYGIQQGVVMENRGSSIFKRRSNKKQTKDITSASTISSGTTNHHHHHHQHTASIFRKPQETKKKGLKRLLFFSFKSKSSNKNHHSLPSLTCVNEMTWSISSDDSESSSCGRRKSFSISSWGHLSCNSIVASPLSVKSGNKRNGSVSPTSSTSSSRSGGEGLETNKNNNNNLKEELVSLRATLNEFQKNECEYRNICDEYEAFVQEQDAEMEQKKLKIMHLKQVVEMMDSKNAEEAKKCQDLEQDLSDCQTRCADQERTIRAKDIKVTKRERELQQQKRVYTTLVLQSQAATQKLQETITAHESHIRNLKAQLEAASRREGLQILQIETFNQELETVSERYRLDSAKAEEKSQENQRRWTMWEE